MKDLLNPLTFELLRLPISMPLALLHREWIRHGEHRWASIALSSFELLLGAFLLMWAVSLGGWWYLWVAWELVGVLFSCHLMNHAFNRTYPAYMERKA